MTIELDAELARAREDLDAERAELAGQLAAAARRLTGLERAALRQLIDTIFGAGDQTLLAVDARLAHAASDARILIVDSLSVSGEALVAAGELAAGANDALAVALIARVADGLRDALAELLPPPPSRAAAAPPAGEPEMLS